MILRVEEASEETAISPYLVIGVVCLGVFIAALDLTVVAPILPQIIYDIQLPITKLDQAAWIISAYLLAYTVTMPLMGRVSDIYGRRLVFVLSLGLFFVGSMVCALAADLPTLIAARAIQALGGGAMVPVAMAIVGDVFPREKRGFAIGIVGAVDTAGWVIGPLYGALVLQALSSWRWIFYINLPVSLIALALIYLVIGRLKRPVTNRSVDYLGALVLVVGLVLLNLALGSGGSREVAGAGGSPFAQETGPLAAYLVPLLAGAGIAMAMFVVVERRMASPLIDLKMFHRLTFSAANLVNLLVGGALIIAMVDVPVFVTVRETARAGEANAEAA
ncbi:MAG: MFS transporter, partial [Chloroflexi bacterium]|nr:MFS transporter [Chloroflexota bacterium]